MPDVALLAAFIPTFLFVSITPGMCMTLAMTLGMSIGVRKSLWMMVGELVGVGLVAIAAVLGVASLMLNYPGLFALFKYVGGAYLIYLGITLWLERGKFAISDSIKPNPHPLALLSQGFLTAVANPKGWAFMVSLLPPFINVERPLWGQLLALVCIILVTEFACLLLYASGGKSLRALLCRGNNVTLLNRIAGSLMALVGVWLAFGD